MRIIPKIEWVQIAQGNERKLRRLKKEYMERGYYTRLRKRNNGSYFTLEIGEPTPYNLNRKER
jgi:hypothetical protein